MKPTRVAFKQKAYQNSTTLLSCVIVVLLFVYLNRVQPHYFVDEAFHIPQTLRYCDGNFTEWDPKITTLPGLYVLTAIVLSPLNLCNIFYIRCINLLGTFANLYLTYQIVNQIHGARANQGWSDWEKLAVTYNIALLPPLFFWHFLYYTDVISVSVVLLMVLLHLRRRFKLAAFVGLLAVLIRQTNIIWLGFLTLERAFDILDTKIEKSVLSKYFSSPKYLKLIWKQLLSELRLGPLSLIKFIAQIAGNLLPYMTVCLLFLAFLVWNKGIVIGDRTAHVATMHIPQLFYFSLFVLAFSWPYMIIHWRSYFNFLQKHWILASSLFAVSVAVVHSNTIVHPYVLADNRHYVFYFWNKFMGRYVIFKYLMIPIYSFAIYAILHNLRHLRFATQINYAFVVSAVLVPQLLLEPRYFIIPYILYRLTVQKPKMWQLAVESLVTLIVNFLQFFIFTNKVFYWSNQPHPQRIGW